MMVVILSLVAISVWLASKGPILVYEPRVGRNGRHFHLLRFRTRRESNESYPVGSFLRKYSLDELPQLLNVLSGTMSLVGPRPIQPAEVEEYNSICPAYFQVKPGLTGLWQISGSIEGAYQEKSHFDTVYAESRSFWLDLKILASSIILSFDNRDHQ